MEGGQYEREPIQLSILTSGQAPVLFHRDAELLYVLEGQLDGFVEERAFTLRAGDILVINTDEKYSLSAAEGSLYAKLSIPDRLIRSTMERADILYVCDSSRNENEQYAELRAAILQLLKRYLGTRSHGLDFGYYAAFYRVLDILTSGFLLQVSDRVGIGDAYAERLLQINSYIHANFNRPISAKELAQKLYLSQGYLSRFFKKNYGVTFAEYLDHVRLYHAAEQMGYTDDSITKIAFDCGFSNAATFSRAFREKYGKSPSEMRRELRQQNAGARRSGSTKAAEQRLQTLLKTDSAKSEPEADARTLSAECSAAVSVELSRYWCDTVNIGAAADLLNSELRRHLVLLSETMGFRYVRFWNIYAQDMLINPGSADGRFNFRKLDDILDFLVEHGLRPHIELGMKPKRLIRNVQNVIVEEAMEEPFHTMNQWRAFLRGLMSHLLRRYHRAELNTWRLELWFNESRWGDAAAEKEYYERFNALYSIAKEYAERIEVGGSGCRSMDIKADGHRFLREWGRQTHRPDYISILCYAYDSGEVRGDHYSIRSTDRDSVRHWIGYTKRTLAEAGMGDIPLYVTEWNHTVSDRNFINDSCHMGAYIIRSILDNYGEVGVLAYFMGSDLVSEHYDSGEFLHGGTGLLTRDGILKPSAQAFRFLNWLYPRLVSKGPNHLLTTDGHGAFALVCHNYKQLNYNYYLTPEDKIEKENIWKYDDNLEKLELTLTLRDAPTGHYQLKTYRINAEIGAPLGIWEEMDYERELTREDIKYLRRSCEPKLTIRAEDVRGGELRLRMSLEPNEIRFVRIRRF